jgi:hypothetical protein
MKKVLLSFIATATVSLFAFDTFGQNGLAPDQNPDFAVSRDKYMKVADSLNSWHSSTQQEIYKAIDWLADRKEARADRREFRRQLRAQRSVWLDYDVYGDYYRGNRYYRYRPYRSYRPFGIRPYYGINFWWR